MKSPTVYDVAQRAGVSIATVSFAFRRPEKVKASTRDLVLAAARELGYVPSASARGLAHGRTGALGLFSFDYLLEDTDQGFVEDRQAANAEPSAQRRRSTAGHGAPPDDDDQNKDLRLFPLYVDEVQRGVELECWRRGLALMVAGGTQASSEAVVADIAGRVDGLAVFPLTVPAELLARIARRIPVVELSEPARDDDVSHVTIDNVGGMRSLTEHLIKDHGLRELAFVGAGGFDQDRRFAGFRGALRGAGMKAPRAPLARPGSVALQATAIVGDLLAKQALPEALVCATDQAALAVMDALRIAGIDVPRRVAVTGFDGIAAGRISRPALTTVRQPMELMGRAAVDILSARLAAPGSAPVSRQLPVRMVLRQSCGCRTR